MALTSPVATREDVALRFLPRQSPSCPTSLFVAGLTRPCRRPLGLLTSLQAPHAPKPAGVRPLCRSCDHEMRAPPPTPTSGTPLAGVEGAGARRGPGACYPVITPGGGSAFAITQRVDCNTVTVMSNGAIEMCQKLNSRDSPRPTASPFLFHR